MFYIGENEITLLVIKYKRVVSSDEVVLTPQNCTTYGYEAKVEGGQTYYFEIGDVNQDILPFEMINGVATTTILVDNYEEFTHYAPPCTSYKVSQADIDKAGSGRNELTGVMYRERVGKFYKIDASWDIIPDSDQFKYWYNVLTHLPPKFTVQFTTPTKETISREFYRSSDISNDAYMVNEEYNMWRNLSVSFTQWDIDEYDETKEND